MKDDPLLNKTQVAKILGVAVSSVVKRNCQMKHLVPPHDVKIKNAPHWKRSTLMNFIREADNKMDAQEVKKLNDLGMLRIDIAKKMNVTLKELLTFCRRHKIRALTSVRTSKESQKRSKDGLFNQLLYRSIKL